MMLICIEIDSALNFFQFISIRSCTKMHFVHYGKTQSYEKWNWRVWKFPAYHGSWEYFQMLTSNILVLKFFVQKQHRIQGVVGTTHPPRACNRSRKWCNRSRSYRFSTRRQRCFFSCRHVRAVTLVTMQPISDDIKDYGDNIKSLRLMQLP